MELIEKSKNILNNIEYYKKKYRSDLNKIKSRLNTIKTKEYEINSDQLESFNNKKKNIIKIFKTNIKRWKKFINLNNNKNFLNNKKFITKCKIVLDQINKYDLQRKEFKKELKEIDKYYENNFEKDIFKIKKKKKNLKSINTLAFEDSYKITKDIEKDTKIIVNSIENIENNKITNNSINNINETEHIKNSIKRKEGKRWVTQLIENQNMEVTKRTKKRKETKKIIFKKSISNFIDYEIDNKIYISNKEDYIYEKNKEKFTLNILNLRFPLINTLFTKAIIKILDENFIQINSEEYSVLSNFESNQKVPSFNYKIKYDLKNCPFDNIYFLVIFVSFYEINKKLLNFPVTWGFSIFHINKFNDLNEVKKGFFQIPVYLPCYLKLKQKELKMLYLNKKLDIINISSLILSNLPTDEKENILLYESGKYNNKEFNPNKYELALITRANQKESINLSFIKYNLLNLKEFNENDLNINYFEIIDYFLQFNKSSINDNIFCYEILDISFGIDLGVKAIVNAKKKLKYRVKATLLSTGLEDVIKKEKLYFKNISDNSFDNFVIFNDKYQTYKKIEFNTDFFLFKIYCQFLDSNKNLIELEYGYSICPVFFNEYFNVKGDFLLPIISNRINKLTVKKIFNQTPFTFCNNLANGYLYEGIKLKNSGLLISIRDSHTESNLKYDYIDFCKINNMFMPFKLSKLYQNIKIIYEDNSTSIKKNNIKFFN